MSWANQEKCPKLRAAGVQLNQSGYSSDKGRPAKHSLKERNEIKKICRECPFPICIYDEVVVQ